MADPDTPCELTGFLNYLICGELRRDAGDVAVAVWVFARVRPADVHRPDRGADPAACLHRAVAAGSWPMVASGAALLVLALDGDIEIAQVCCPWDADKALLLHERQVRRNRRR